MKRGYLLLVIAVVVMAGCKNDKASDQLEVSGTITNTIGKMIYLEEIPIATMQRIIVDSAALGADGKYKLKTKTKEAGVYNLRLDQNTYPLASVVNDASKITFNASFTDKMSQFPDKYEVKGSEASQQMKDFMTAFNNDLQQIYQLSRQADSLQAAGVPDSSMMGIQNQHAKIAAGLKQRFQDAIVKSNNPALSIFLLGYYQTTANNPAFGLHALENEEVEGIVNSVASKYPDHSGVNAIKTTLDAQQQQQEPITSAWVGKPAPDISLPDVNGKPIKLSSYRGKYVLVDFWASWCKPCRHENPAVVSAYKKYKDKNFTVLGVSLDKEKAAWLKAIRDDKLEWTHVSDLQYWDSPVVGIYGINGIPFNVLVDPEGKIVAEGLRGEALHAKLGEVLN